MKEINQRGETEWNPTKVRKRLKQHGDKKQWFLSVHGEHLLFLCVTLPMGRTAHDLWTDDHQQRHTQPISTEEGSHGHRQEPESSESSSFPLDRGFGQVSKGCYREQRTQSHWNYNSWDKNNHHAQARLFRRNTQFLRSSILKELVGPSQSLPFSILKVIEKFHTNGNEASNTQHYTAAELQFRQHALNFCDCTRWIFNKSPSFPAEWSPHAINRQTL